MFKLAVTVVLSVLLACCGSAEDSATGVTLPAPESSPAGTSTSSAATTTSMAMLSTPWIEIEPARIHEPAPSAVMRTIIAGTSGLIAGGALERPESTDAAIWTSDDGSSWHLLPDPKGVLGVGTTDVAADQWVVDLVAWDGGWVAVGVDGSLDDFDIAVWRADAAGTWGRVATGDVFDADGHQVPKAITSWNGLLIVVGSSAGEAAVWTSADGARWEAAIVTDVAGAQPSAVTDVAAGGPGLVAVGYAGTPARGAVWLSANGLLWSRATEAGPVPNLAVEGHLLGEGAREIVVCRTPQGLVTLGSTRNGPAVWTSEDGVEWHDARASFLDEPTPLRPGGRFDYLKDLSSHAIVDVLWHHDRLVAVGGYDLAPTASMVPRFITVWTSDDLGATWRAEAEWIMEPTFSQNWRGAMDFAAAGDTLLIVGMDDRPTVEDQYGYMQYELVPAAFTAHIASR